MGGDGWPVASSGRWLSLSRASGGVRGRSAQWRHVARASVGVDDGLSRGLVIIKVSRRHLVEMDTQTHTDAITWLHGHWNPSAFSPRIPSAMPIQSQSKSIQFQIHTEREKKIEIKRRKMKENEGK